MCTEFLYQIYKHSWENDYGYNYGWAYVQVLCGFKTNSLLEEEAGYTENITDLFL